MKKIIIEGFLPDNYSKDSLELETANADYISNKIKWNKIRVRSYYGYFKAVLYSSKSLKVNISQMLGRDKSEYMIEPGDSIYIHKDKGLFEFCGIGVEKFKLQWEIGNIEDSIIKPKNHKFWTIHSLKDYLDWNNYVNRRLNLMLPLIDTYKKRISEESYNYIKLNTIAYHEYVRLFKFGELYGNANKLKVSQKSLCDIFDSTLNNVSSKWLQSNTTKAENVYYFYDYIRKLIYREYEFDKTKIDSFNSGPGRKEAYYSLAKQRYSGETLENYFAFLLTEQGIKEHGYDYPIGKLLLDYYSESDFPEYKNYVKAYETVVRERNLEPGRVAPQFILNDINGKSVDIKDLQGKVVLINFRYNGCKDCKEIETVINDIKDTFNDDTSILFLNIATDQNEVRWRRNVRARKQSNVAEINLYAGTNSLIAKAYDVSEDPKFYLVDPYGRIVECLRPNDITDRGRTFIKLVNNQLAKLNDGPYVVYDSDSISIYSIYRSLVNSTRIKATDSLKIKVQTDKLGQSFQLGIPCLKDIEPSKFNSPEKIFVISDIEGNFDAFTRLLQANKVIDEQYNWIFNRGHLVLNGDIFDRGVQVTECLWFIYMLEEKARAAGGYVHFVLGNHEIMNLTGNLKYVHQKYKDNSKLIQVSYQALYGLNSELGRWLRTKNVIEKVGDLLFVHGGISQDILKLDLSIEEINNVVRGVYAGSSANTIAVDYISDVLFDTKTSPFWIRGYYDQEAKISSAVIDSTLKKFEVSRIVTGHTIVSDTISLHYGGKVINTDTKHAIGRSEALVIENGKYYRVNKSGVKILLDMDLKTFINNSTLTQR